MTNKLSEKKTPCEECREQKRKCDCKSPCDRCERFNLKCVYLKALSPRDQEFVQYAREEQLRTEIETLTDQIDMMHDAIMTLRSGQHQQEQQQPLSPLPSLTFSDDYGSSSSSNNNSNNSSPPRAVAIPPHPHSCYSPPHFKTNALTPEQSNADDCVNSNTSRSSVGHIRKKARSNVIAQEGSVTVSMMCDTRLEKSWTLCLQRDGGMVIETYVNQYSDLLPHLHTMFTTLKAQDNVPFSLYAHSTIAALFKAYNNMMLNKYGKTVCRSWINSMRLNAAAPPPSVSSAVCENEGHEEGTTPSSINPQYLELLPPVPLETVIFPLIDAYVDCMYYHHLAIHIPTFNRLFVDAYAQITQSSAAMALCASICVFPCHHVTDILPRGTCHLYSRRFFALAREQVADRFDDVCLETFTTYVFLSIYEMAVLNSTVASGSTWHYTHLAHRMAEMLRPAYVNLQSSNTDGEVILFHRLYSYLQRMRMFELAVEFHDNDHNMRETGYARFYAMRLNQTTDVWVRAPDDTDLARDLVEMHQHLQVLRKEIYNSSRPPLPTMMRDICELTELVVQQQVRDAMGHWYTHTLPEHLRLSLPLLSGMAIDDDFYFRTLVEDVEHKGVAPVLTTLALYEEGLLIALAYFHKRLHGSATSWRMLDHYWQGGKLIMDPKKRREAWGNKWARRIDKILSLKPAIDFVGTDDEFYHMVKTVMFPGVGKTSILFISVYSAINALRLLRFLQSSSSNRCFFDVRVLMDTWTVLIRAVMFEKYFDEDEETLIPSIRQAMEACLSMTKTECAHAERGLSSHIQTMEKELREYYMSSSFSSIPSPVPEQ